MKRPNLFIVGAPKCGTTAMAKWLSAHPQIYMSPVKEPHYFSEDHRLTPTLQAYEALFADADPNAHRWVCEASVWHLFSDSAVPNILEYSPDAHFIVMLRNPLEMAPSMHEQHCFNGNERVADFAEALALNDVRSSGRAVGIRSGYAVPQHMAYLSSCALGWQLERLLGRVPRDRVHVVVHDDIVQDAAQVHAGVLRFLGLPEAMPPDFQKVNAAKRRRSSVLDDWVLRMAKAKRRFGISGRLGLLARTRRWNVHYRDREPVSPDVRDMMAASFAKDVDRLGSLIDRNLSHWLPVRNG